MSWGSLSEKIRRSRIKIAVAAYAYTYSTPIMSDQTYDRLSQQIHKTRNIATGHHRLHRIFQRHFDPYTSLWIHDHPHLRQIQDLYYKHYR